VLLAEDTPANQKVVRSILQKRGHSVTIAQNGREAVDLFRAQRFDVILMDVQMPIMDGFHATAAIRAAQDKTMDATPIIAMTAHAMRGDREKCLAAGMDAYLAKPIDVKELLTMIEGARRNGDGEREMPVEVENVIDVESALKRLAGDADLFRELADMFAEDAPKLVEALETAIAEGRGSAVQRAAHSLKGLAANFGAAPMVAVAQEVELAGKREEIEIARGKLAELKQRLSTLQEALRPYRTA
jgi:CheY-like chemotaxis protein